MSAPDTRSPSPRALACALALLAALRPAGAQDHPDTTALSPVVVTAARVPTAATVSDASTTVVTGAELRARGATTLVEALRTVGGLALAQTAGPGSQASLFLRGGNSNFTKVLVDGVPVNAPGGALDISTLTTDDIERIEILRGPASVQYGSDAMSGVVQIFTRREPGTSVTASVGDRQRQYDLSGGTAASRQLGGGARGYASLGGGVHRGDGFLPFNHAHRIAAGNAIAGVTGARGEATVAASWDDARYHYPTTGSGTPTDSNAFTGSRRTTLGATARWQAGDRFGARAQLARADSRSLSDDQPDSPGDSLGFYSASHGRATRESAELQLVATLPATIGALVGGALEGQRVESRGWSRFQRFPADTTTFDEARTNRALFAQLSAGKSRLTGTAGGRRERLANGRFVNTGRIGVASSVVPGTVVRGSIGTAFKEPAFDEIFDGPFSVGAHDLRPERSRSREVGAESRLASGRLTVGATLFDQRFTDLVQYRIVDHSVDPLVPDYYNVVAARARGVELEGRVIPLSSLALHASYSLLATKVTNEGNGGFGAVAKGKPLLRRPRRTATLDGIFRSARLTLSAQANRVGARDDYDYGFPGGRVRLAAYTLVGAAMELPLLTPRRDRWTVALTARGENLTDRRYQNVYGFATPGRVVFAGLRLHD